MKIKFFLLSLIGTILLTACAPATPIVPTPDVLAIRTSAAFTVVAEFTLTAAAFSPTPLPPSETPTQEPPTPTATEALTTDPTLAALGTPASLCDDYTFVADVTIPDGTAMTPNQEFVKTWKIRNSGDCAWGDGYAPIYSYGEKMSGLPVPLSIVVAPGDEVDVSVNLKAPSKIGSYLGAWVMVNPKGFPFGTKVNTMTVQIVVK